MIDHQFLNLLILSHYLFIVIYSKVPFQFSYIDLLLAKLDIIWLNLSSFLHVRIAFTIMT